MFICSAAVHWKFGVQNIYIICKQQQETVDVVVEVETIQYQRQKENK